MARKSRKNISSAAVAVPLPNAYQAGAYLRLSSDDTKKRGDSIATQRSIIESYIDLSTDIELCRIYTDNNMTGTNFDRPGFKQMLADAERGIINCIIVKDLSRFGRNAIDAGYYIERYLPSLHVRFIAVTDDFDTNISDGGLIVPLKNVINEAYALDISRKCKAVQRQNIKDGRYVGRLAPYGYLKDPKDCHQLIIDPKTAPVIRQVFEWAAEGKHAPEITRQLNDMGIPSPTVYKHSLGQSTNGKPAKGLWQLSSIRSMLSDPVYAGDMAQGRTEQINHKRIDIPRSQWIVVRDTHEPLVSRDTFQSVQSLTEQYSEENRENRNPKIPYTESIFKGKVYCAHCGYAMHRHRTKDVYWFNCQTQHKYSKNACRQVSVKEEDVKAQLAVLLTKHAEVILGGYAGLCRQAVPIMEGGNEAELRAITQEIDNNSRFLKSLYESLVATLITPVEFISMKADYQKRIEALTERAGSLRKSKRELDAKLDEYHGIVNNVLAVKGKFDLTAALVECLVEKILVHHDKSVEMFLCYSDEFQVERGVHG